MEPLSRVSGGPLCPPRPCTPTARLRASATSRRNRIFLEDIEKNIVLTAFAEVSFGFGRLVRQKKRPEDVTLLTVTSNLTFLRLKNSP